MIVGIFVQGFWLSLYLVDHGMDPGRVLTTFYACLAAIQSIDSLATVFCAGKGNFCWATFEINLDSNGRWQKFPSFG